MERQVNHDDTVQAGIKACRAQLRVHKSHGLSESASCEIDEYLFFASEYARIGDVAGAKNALDNARRLMPARLMFLPYGAT